MPDERTSRFADFAPMDRFRDTCVQVVGCGSIGRAVGLLLAQMGVRYVHLWDHDTVETSNLGTQGWSAKHLGRPKVLALKEDMAQKWPRTQRSRLHYIPYMEAMGHLPPNYEGKLWPAVTFLCVDSIPARRDVVNLLEKYCRYSHLIDARVLGETGRVLQCPLWIDTPRKEYLATLPSEEQVVHGPCTSKMTPYGAQVAACLMVQTYCSLLRGDTPPADVIFNLAEPYLGITLKETPIEATTTDSDQQPLQQPPQPVALRGVDVADDTNPTGDPVEADFPF